MNLPRSGRDTGPVLHDGFYKLAATVTRRSLKPKVTCQPTTDGSGTATIWAFCHLRQILFKVVLAICSIFLGVGTSLYISIWSCPESFRKSHPQNHWKRFSTGTSGVAWAEWMDATLQPETYRWPVELQLYLRVLSPSPFVRQSLSVLSSSVACVKATS